MVKKIKIAGAFSLLCCLLSTTNVSAENFERTVIARQDIPEIYQKGTDPREIDGIIQLVQNDDDALTTKRRQQFWSLLDKAKTSPQAIQALHDRTSLMPRYYCAVFQDALTSYQTNRPVKSRARERAEQEIRTQLSARDANHYIGGFRQIITQAAAHQLIANPDFSDPKLMDAELIQNFRDLFMVRQNALELLFTRPEMKTTPENVR